MSRYCSKLEVKNKNRTLKVVLLIFEAKMHWRNKLVAFQQFPGNCKCQQWVFSALQSLLLISGVSEFLFFGREHTIEHIGKPGKFQSMTFQMGDLFSYYLENLVNHSLCLWQKCQSIAQSYQCKQRIESWNSCAHLRSQNSIDIPSWLLLSTFLINIFARNGCFLIQKASVDF